MTLIYSKEARDRIKTIPPEVKRGIKEALEDLRVSPYQGKPLQKELEGFYSLRFEKYRIIYEMISPQKIYIRTLGHRKDIYEEILKKV